MSEFAASTFSGLIGALFGAAIAYYLTRQAQKVSFTFDLHKEFNTVEMGRHRYEAEQLLKKYPELTFEHLGEKDTVKMDSLYVILRFYQRVGLAVKYGQVHKGLIRQMFATNFYYWYYISFEPGFVEIKLNGSEHLVYLASWFYRTIGLELDSRLKANSKKQLVDWIRASSS
jgi:hypothetical protein